MLPGLSLHILPLKKGMLKMFDSLGYSVYLSTYETIKQQLQQLYTPGSYLFTSFHISEEMDESYVEKAKSMCRELNDMGYQIIGDVSRTTLTTFGCQDLNRFADMLGLSMLRIDYGFSDTEMIEISKQIPICFNASTVQAESVKKFVSEAEHVYGMHNFYPRPETGLDAEFFTEINEKWKRLGLTVIAFIPGDTSRRGPLHEGLPTLEAHRNASPFAAYVDLKVSYGIDGVCVGDGVISQYDRDRVRAFNEKGILEIPVILEKDYEDLYGKSFTIRPDSPRWIKRLAQSREYSGRGFEVLPKHIGTRAAGCITMDNARYLRYSGEIHIVTEDLPKDDRVNVIGRIGSDYKLLLKNIKNGQRIQFAEIK